MIKLQTPTVATDLNFLVGCGFQPFEVLEADLTFYAGETAIRALVMFDAPLNDWAELSFTVEGYPKWRGRVGTRRFEDFVTALGLRAVNDTDDLISRRGGLRVGEDGKVQFAALAA